MIAGLIIAALLVVLVLVWKRVKIAVIVPFVSGILCGALLVLLVLTIAAKRCAFCKSPNWNRLETPDPDGTEIAPTEPDSTISDSTESAEELDATAPEVHGRGKATLTKVVKRKPEQSSQPCRHGLFYHPNCNG